jgi:hypothetical protein
MDIPNLEEQLASAQKQLAQLLHAGRSVDKLQKSFAAFEAVASAQRALAAAKGEEYAVPYDLGFVPEAAVSEPVLLQTDSGAILTFSAMRERHDGKREDAGYGIVEIDSCSLTKFGYPNDEALPGHPLHGRGLGAYGVFEVHNSSWIKTKAQQNRVAFPNYALWPTQRHFIFTLHDSTFECIARGLRGSVSTKPYADIFEDIRRRIFKSYRDA